MKVALNREQFAKHILQIRISKTKSGMVEMVPP